MSDQRAYWDHAAGEKTFTHPLDRAWLIQRLRKDARILDYGCGYGRILEDLTGHGYRNTVGADFSAQMIARGQAALPDADLRVTEGRLDEPDASFDAVFLFAVLTCVPDDVGQETILGEALRLLRPGGLIYISDMPMQADLRNQQRYARSRLGVHGVFRTDDGAIVRHHDPSHIEGWLRGFTLLARKAVEVRTMNGTAATAVQLLAAKDAA